MKRKVLWELRRGSYRVRAEMYERSVSTPLAPPIARTTWKRALRVKNKYGAARALELIDERAWRAFHRGDDATSRRWRDLIIAIHAMDEDELLSGEHVQ